MPNDDNTSTAGTGAQRRWGTAVVIGGGFAGLVTARVLADFFAEVIILEQDPLDEDSGVHPHVPQGYHAHAVLAKGGQILEQFFPGLRAQLQAAGAPVFDYGKGINFLLPVGYAPRTDTGVQVQTVTRDELERTVRRRVLALPQVSLRDASRCLGLTVGSRGRVTGVTYVHVPASTGSGESSPAPADAPVGLAADLVVDASGRTSALPAWLALQHLPVPAKRVVKAKITYTSVSFERRAEPEPDFTVAYQMTFARDVPRGGVVLAVERDRWMCSLFGFDEHVPPTDDEGYLEFARSLANPNLAKVLEHRGGQDGVRRYTNMNNEWNRYHRMRAWPQRLIALGDAVCVFNPVYGQGLTIAALHAELLRRMLADRREAGRGLDGVSRAFQRRLVKLVRPAWVLSSSSDLVWNPQHQPVSARIAHWYNRHLFAVATRDPRVWTRFVRVANMVAPPTALFAPQVVGKVVAQALLRRPPAASGTPSATERTPGPSSPAPVTLAPDHHP
ncbi:MAG TPA: FAD-dependent monooxygenase [Actinocrinis sp.]|nr:FAD-dependent monooxygenase [Actinocrinis sp.]